MIEQSTDCVFNSDGYCLHSNKHCTKPCKYGMKEYKDLSFSEHFELYWRRKEHSKTLIARWSAVFISVLAMTLSLYTHISTYSMQNNNLQQEAKKIVNYLSDIRSTIVSINESTKMLSSTKTITIPNQLGNSKSNIKQVTR